jgi:chromosome segregation protein
MRLKRIKLSGFKSFVDPTTITLPGQLIGVVGPNGCGKSNVIDAVRWVMGESSARHLRGDSLEDVIFNGSTSRKPVGHAAIELCFDNSEGRIGGQYANYSEIAIKRQLSRDGQSVYYLNGTRCRRKDITDIFLGTGLGPRSYAIIEQGTISRLIEAKPEEMRVFLEEAAGISKYKERRRETENRIRNTKENISRINDLIEEINKRLQTLQRQAKAAEKFKELKQEERLLKAQTLALRWRALDQEVRDKNRQITADETALEGQLAELRAVEARIEKHRTQHAEENEAFNRIQGEFYSVGSEIARLEQSIQHATEMRQQNQRDLEELEKSRVEIQGHFDHDSIQLEKLKQDMEATEPGIETAQQAEAASATALVDAEQAMQTWQHEWEALNAAAAAELQVAEVERTRITHLEDHLARLQARLSRHEAEQQELSSHSLQQESNDLKEKVTEFGSILDKLRNDLHSILGSIGEQRDTNDLVAAELENERDRLLVLQKQHTSLDTLQKAALGKSETHVTNWLEENGLHDIRRLAESIEVVDGWERAVETVLGLTLELASLRQGTLTVFDTSVRVTTSRGKLTAAQLLDKVNAPWQLDSLFAGIYAVDTLAEALALRTRLGANESVVTRDGVWIGNDWLRIIREADEKAGVLVREQELKQLSRQLDKATAHVEKLERDIQEGGVQLKSREEERDTLQARINEAAHQHAELRTQLSSKDARLEQIQTRHDNLHNEMAEIQAQMAGDRQELNAAHQRLEKALSETGQHEKQRTAMTGRRDELRAVLESRREQARHDRDASRESVLRAESIRSQLTSLNESHERMQHQLAQMQRRHDELTASLADGNGPIDDMKAELEAMLAKRLEVESALATARQQVETCEHSMRELNEKRGVIELKTQQMRSDLEKVRLDWRELQVRSQTLQEQIFETSYQLESLLAEIPDEADDEIWQEKISDIEQKVQRLGAINLAAIEEFSEQSERKDYLDSQHADLTEAMMTLENAIRKIDQETRARFKETFDRVNERLQTLFPRLFGGGIARMEMTSDNLLDTGIAIMAQPPGKRNSNIHLLSGGEKALTAVALVFAMFELNPAPFCFLDEVDAPLDDNNAIRFCQLVSEMSERVQFLFITHNKITMEMAHQLIGVTMQEPGVSRLVAVDVDEAVDMVATG